MESNIPMCQNGRFFSLTLMLNLSETYTKISTEHSASHLLSRTNGICFSIICFTH